MSVSYIFPHQLSFAGKVSKGITFNLICSNWYVNNEQISKGRGLYLSPCSSVCSGRLRSVGGSSYASYPVSSGWLWPVDNALVH